MLLQNSNDPYYERKCITLIKRYPEAINYALPHLYFTPFLVRLYFYNIFIFKIIVFKWRKMIDLSFYFINKRACYAGNYHLVKVMLEMGKHNIYNNSWQFKKIVLMRELFIMYNAQRKNGKYLQIWTDLVALYLSLPLNPCTTQCA